MDLDLDLQVFCRCFSHDEVTDFLLDLVFLLCTRVSTWSGHSTSPCRSAPMPSCKRRDGASTRQSVHTPSTHTVRCGPFGPRTGSTPMMTPVGVPVTRHFDPLRASPFDLAKFDRRDPYRHFYIPVDCPLARR